MRQRLVEISTRCVTRTFWRERLSFLALPHNPHTTVDVLNDVGQKLLGETAGYLRSYA